MPQDTTFALLPLGSIVASATNPRKTFDEAKLAELAASIAASGVHQPVLVRRLPASRLADTAALRPKPEYELVAGERRLRASRIAKAATIPAMVRELTDEQVLEIQLVENLQRDDLHAMEEAEGYERLCATTGIKKEDIAAKIGKSRSYVYQRIKLIELCQEGRAAFYAGKLDASRALLIARIPNHKLQIKAVEHATQEGWNGQPSVRQLQAWCETNVFLHLERAVFPITDAKLVPAAGSCKACPKRTGAEPDIFADVASADLCTDPACYHDKEHTHHERELQRARNSGNLVIEGEAAKDLQPHKWDDIDGYYRLDQPHPDLDDDDGGDKSLAKLLGKDCPKPIFFHSPHTGEVIPIAPFDEIDDLCEVKGLFADEDSTTSQRRDQRTKSAEPEPVTERWAYRRAVTERVETATRKGLKALGRKAALTPELLRSMMIEDMGYNGGEHLALLFDNPDTMDDDAIEAALRAMPDADVPGVVLQWLVGYASGHRDTLALLAESAPRHLRVQLADMAGVDIRKIAATVKREMEAEDRAQQLEEEKKKKAASTPAPAAQPAKPGKAAPAKAGKAKLSAADAKAQIAQAMAAADPPPAPPSVASPRTDEPGQATGWVIGDLARIKPDVKNASGKVIPVAGLTGKVVGLIRGKRLQVAVGSGSNLKCVTLRYLDVEPATAEATA